MGSKPPTPGEMLEFLGRVQNLLDAALYTTTYKFAMLIALTDYSVKHGSDDGRSLRVPMDGLADEFRRLYEPMARPYTFPTTRESALIRQTTDHAKQLAVLSILTRAIPATSTRHRHVIVVRDIRKTLARDVLYRLQSVGAGGAQTIDQFLYPHPSTAAACARLESITLNEGVAACLRRLRGVIVPMVQARWARWIREHDERLGPETQLEPFLFGSDRVSLTHLGPPLWELQNRRCFYRGTPIASPSVAHVDHFIPWSWYPCNSPFNLVLASKKANIQKRDRLPCEAMREQWNERNTTHRDRLNTLIKHKRHEADADDHVMVEAIAAWAYRLGRAAHSRMWDGREAI